MKDWKTTIGGAIMAAATAITLIVQQGESIADWKTWIVPAAMAIYGYISKDKTT